MENNIMQNAINYLAQSLSVTPNQLIEAYSAQGQAMAYMLLMFAGLWIVMALMLFCLWKSHKDMEISIIIVGWIFVIMTMVILVISYDVFLWISDPRAYAIQEIIRDIRLWK